MNAIRLINRILVRIETVFLVLFLGVMVLLAFLQVVLRNLFDTGLLWGDPLVRQMVLWSGFVGAALAASQDRHISIDALTKFIPPRAQHIVAVITNLFAAAVCYWLASSAWEFMVGEREAGGELFLGIPSWVGLAIIPVGYGLLTFHFLLNMVERGFRALGRDGEAPVRGEPGEPGEANP